MKTLTLLLLLSLLATSCGQSNTFDATTRVESPRVIAITAEPPGVAPNETIEIHATVATPAFIQRAFRYRWQACVFVDDAQSGFNCPTTVTGLPVDNLLADSEEKVFTFTQNIVTDDMLNDACIAYKKQAAAAGIPVELLDYAQPCTEGLMITIRFQLCEEKEPCSTKDGWITTTQLPLLRESAKEDAQRNHNPVIQAITIDGNSLSDDSSDHLTLRPGSHGYSLALTIDPDVSAEFYSLLVLEHPSTGTIEGRVEQVQEQLKVMWFATGGVFEKATGRYDGIGGSNDTFATNTLMLNDEDFADGERLDLWVVLQDSRMGTHAMHRTLTLNK